MAGWWRGQTDIPLGNIESYIKKGSRSSLILNDDCLEIGYAAIAFLRKPKKPNKTGANKKSAAGTGTAETDRL